MSYIAVFAVALMITLPGCGPSHGEPSCTTLQQPYESCYGYGPGAQTLVTTCEADFTYRVCERQRYWSCYFDNECSDTNDTDTIAKLEACLEANKRICD